MGAWKEMRQIWRKQEPDQNYQFDTKVPDLKKKHNSFEDPLISSIGDLAPHSLR